MSPEVFPAYFIFLFERIIETVKGYNFGLWFFFNEAGSRACDWQRNMLEQRVQTFRQLMREVGGADEMDFFGNSMLFPGYPSYHVPNPNFALRGSSIGPPGSGPSGIIGLAGMGRARNTNYKM